MALRAMRVQIWIATVSAAFLLAAGPVLVQGCKQQLAESDVARVRIADEKSATRVFGDTSNLPNVQDKDARGVDDDFSYVCFLTSDGRQEARFYIHYGDIFGSYNEIKVMPVTKAGAGARRLPVDSLATERGVWPGMKQAELIQPLGLCHKTFAARTA
jgi:hypothetical protein